MKPLNLNIEFETQLVVSSNDTASKYGSGLAEVFATPAMIGMMENTAQLSVKKYLEGDEITVGSEVNIKHIKATPIGMKVICKSKLIEIDNKKLVFAVSAFDMQGEIGNGTHTRYIVNLNKFMNNISK